jgi:hypothetical protein
MAIVGLFKLANFPHVWQSVDCSPGGQNTADDGSMVWKLVAL